MGKFMRAGGLTKRIVPALVAGAMGVTGLGVSAASAGVAQSSIVSERPAAYTPDLAKDAVVSHPASYAVEQGSTMMYVGGQFNAVQNGNGSGGVGPVLTRKNFLAFDISNGQVSTTMMPTFDGNVWAIRYSAGSLYVAGEFTTVNGQTGHGGIVKINATTGAVDPAFHQPWGSGKAYDLQVVGGRVIVGGTFAGALLALNPATGANLHYFDSFSVSGTCVNNLKCGTQNTPTTNEPTHVYRFAVNDAGTRLVAIGNFDAPHPRAFMVDLGASAGTLDAWYYRPFAHTCQLPKVYPAYLRDVDFSPDGSYFVVVATGYVVANNDPALLGVDVCDAAARFETNTPNQSRATRINYTGGDTLHAVVVTGAAVYVQGHNRWLDNAGGWDTCNAAAGCVGRPGIGAIDPNTGRALPWNPTKTRNVGGKDLLSTSQGIWVASDGPNIGKTAGDKYHYGIALLPL